MSRSRALNLTPEANAPTPRSRVRPTSEPSEVMVTDAKEFFLRNKEKNAATSAEKKAKDRLHKAMLKGSVSDFEFEGEYNGNTTRMQAVIDADIVEVMDVNKLKDIVDDETFMKIVSATKTAITAIAGEHVAMQCATDFKKPPSLKLRKAT